MSLSPPIRRLSTSTKREEDLINAYELIRTFLARAILIIPCYYWRRYEAEEERIINILSRKLEQVPQFLTPPCACRIDTSLQLREEKISLENTLEAESEAHVNRLSRELSVLRLAQQQAGTASGADSPEARAGFQAFLAGSSSTGALSAELMLDAMRRENEDLRHRLVGMERDYIRVVRLNDVYREELIEHRERVSGSP